MCSGISKEKILPHFFSFSQQEKAEFLCFYVIFMPFSLCLEQFHKHNFSFKNTLIKKDSLLILAQHPYLVILNAALKLNFYIFLRTNTQNEVSKT